MGTARVMVTSSTSRTSKAFIVYYIDGRVFISSNSSKIGGIFYFVIWPKLLERCMLGPLRGSGCTTLELALASNLVVITSFDGSDGTTALRGIF